MPTTKKGAKIKKAMIKEYGEKKGKSVYYASIVKGKIKGAESKGGTGRLAKAKRTYAKKHSTSIPKRDKFGNPTKKKVKVMF